MRRVGRSWYAFGPDGSIIGMYADMRDMRASAQPFPNVPGLPGATHSRTLPGESADAAGFDFRHFEDMTRRRGRTFTAYIEYEPEQDPIDVLMAKVQTLADRGATEGERAAARAALVRLAARK